MTKKSLKIALIVMVSFFLVNPSTVKAMAMTGLLNVPAPEVSAQKAENYGDFRLPTAGPAAPRYSTVRVITAYSSTPDQTDSTPFITANGMTVNDNLVAANWLKFGTRVRIPDYFGDKVFVVADRMHPRFDDRLDVWMGSREEAMTFGIRRLAIEVF